MRENHGLYKRPEYAVWIQIKQRCLNPRCRAFKNYGGRGLTICERWENSFANFLADMGERPTDKHSIDRTDNARGYSPDNCRWATKLEQTNNTRANVTVLFQGASMTFAEAYRKSGTDIGQATASARFSKGWTVEDALFSPLHLEKRRVAS